ncbi:alcohol dehydrogenase catalytic domain-containing protein [Heyndrickxia acidicola]|uniref:Alcohol dehydrogenase catalytic domain-containing protein n=1 Tax=Heyndrickxia acidicola TaxID=209389 RepID=A0ABU6MHP9_9BACI|nr:alcohol dehydrogenase catalytic domain-containing protein [Heyndrickxia acidicola]MED1204196.1 alcohol dehydrogenase catalytic domain-containing protein [Heyndrickxia acidicola]
MQTISKLSRGPGAAFEQMEIPVPKENEVLISIKITALCGTDLHIYEWNNWAANANILIPGIMGHECVGEVVETGTHVTSLRKGDRVSVETHIPCGTCDLCLNGKEHICENLRLFGLHTNGCFADYAVVPEKCARKIPPEIPDEIASVLEPLGVGVHAAQKAEIKDKRVAILGAGPIGIFAASACNALGARSVTISDLQSSRLDIASKCTDVSAWNPLNTDISSLFNKPNAPDVIIETTGNSRALAEALPFLKKGGTVILCGLFSNEVSLNLSADIVFKEAAVYGIHGRRMWDTWSLTEDLLTQGKLDIRPALTHQLPLKDFSQAFEIAHSGQGVKVLLIP